MKLDSTIGKIGHNNPRLVWPVETIEAGGYTWEIWPGVPSFNARLKSGQHLSVRFYQSDPEAVAAIPSTMMVLIDSVPVVVGEVDTRKIPAGAIRNAVEALIVKMGPITKKVWADELAYRRAEEAKYRNSAPVRQMRADRKAVIDRASREG